MIQISSVIFIKMFIGKTVGDSWNDISLFQACDESYAVANASSKLKAIATATIKSNIEDGVADFLSKLLK